VLTCLTILFLTVGFGTVEPDLPRGGGRREISCSVPDSGKLCITDPWMIEGSLSIRSGDFELVAGSDYVWIDSLREVEFPPGGKVAAGDEVTLSYQSAAVIDTLVFQLFFPSNPDTSGTPPDSTDIRPRGRPLNPLKPWKGLRRTGTITRGVRFDRGGSGGVTSGLHLELSGEPTSDIRVDAVLDDRNMPASSGGASASLAELDRLLFRVEARHFLARLGDLDLDWENGRYGSFSRSLKGGSLRASCPLLRGELAAVGGNNSFITVNFPGRDGDQGPYYLTDRFGRSGITISAGSETVYLDGERLKRGGRADYVVDYTRGSLRFNPRRPIRSDSRIEVEYEYNDEGYPRYLYAATAGTPGESAAGLSVAATAAVEGGDNDNPLAFDWTDEWRGAVAGAGDDPLGALVSGIDSLGPGRGDYVWGVVDGDSVLVFAPPDSLGRPTGYLQVEFSQLPGGGYRREYDAGLYTFYYRWVSADSGDWAPVRYLPLPERAEIVAVRTNFNSGGLEIGGEIALSSFDRNTLSNLDDHDNKGAAWLWRGSWMQRGGLSPVVTASVRREDENFHPLSRGRDVDYLFRWDVADDTTRSETEYNAGLDLTPTGNSSFSAATGFLRRAGGFEGRRYDLSGGLSLPHLDLTSRIDRTEGDYLTENRESVRTGLFGGVSSSWETFQPSCSVRSEERRVSESGSNSGYRYLEREIGLGIKPGDGHDIHLGFNSRSDDALTDSGADHRSDTRTLTADWSGSGYRWGGWSIDLLRYHQTYSDAREAPVTATSAAFETTVSPPGSPWKLRVDYNLSSGNDRAGAQIAAYVGEGLGNYRREGDRYVPDPDGDFNLYLTTTDTLRRVSRVYFAGQLNWSPRRRRNDQKEVYPLGITGVNSRFEANLSTTSTDPWRAFLLYPPEFAGREAVYARRSWLEDIYFLEGNPGGDGRLSLQREINRDRKTGGGETTTLDRVSFRVRLKPGGGFRLQLAPSWQRNRRDGITLGEARSDVTGTGGDLKLTFRRPDDNVEYGLTYGFERRADRISDVTVKEQRASPRLTWYIGSDGAARIEGGWRRLASTSSFPGYDLARSWVVGNNWSLDLSVDYRLGANVTATAYFRGLWRGDNRPRNTGLIEFTANL